MGRGIIQHNCARVGKPSLKKRQTKHVSPEFYFKRYPGVYFEPIRGQQFHRTSFPTLDLVAVDGDRRFGRNASTYIINVGKEMGLMDTMVSIGGK